MGEKDRKLKICNITEIGQYHYSNNDKSPLQQKLLSIEDSFLPVLPPLYI